MSGEFTRICRAYWLNGRIRITEEWKEADEDNLDN